MKYPGILLIFSIFFIVGMGNMGLYQKNVIADEEWTASFEAFKPAEDTKYHQRNTGGVKWYLFHDQPNDDVKNSKPRYTDIYWIEGEKAWVNRIKDVGGKSELSYLDPADLPDEKYHSPCPLCENPTYFWLDAGFIDGETVKFIKTDFPGWKKEDGVCRNCFECYAVRSGQWYDGEMATTTDIYTIGFNKRKWVLEYFEQVR